MDFAVLEAYFAAESEVLDLDFVVLDAVVKGTEITLTAIRHSCNRPLL